MLLEIVACPARLVPFHEQARDPARAAMMRDGHIAGVPHLPALQVHAQAEVGIIHVKKEPGPRPEVPEFVGKYPEQDKRIILSVPPGMTDFASIRFRHEEQILAGRRDRRRYYELVLLPSKLRYCRFYIRRANLRLDLYIIGQTILALSSDRLGNRLLARFAHRSLARGGAADHK